MDSEDTAVFNGKDEAVTIDDTVVSLIAGATDSLNNSLKRKADDSDLDITTESYHPQKKQCMESAEESINLPDHQIITVCFGSQQIARKYCRQITDFVAQLTKSDISTYGEKDGVPCVEFHPKIADIPGSEDEVEAIDHDSFAVDTLPQYDQTFTGIVGSSSDKQDEKKDSRPKNLCFNCEGDHMIAACPEPRDSARIAKNRRQHAGQNPSYNRYHEEADQRFSHLTPGTISAGLRRALSLRDCDLPVHVYRMRVLGYPPGWLRAARQQRSNIAVHHDPKPESNGKPQQAAASEELTYDLTKLITFPGFNVRQPKDVVDEHHRLGFPPMQWFQSLGTMQNKLRTRRQGAAPADNTVRLPPSAACKRADDMDIADADGSQATSDMPETDDDGTTEASREGSPSLETLEEQLKPGTSRRRELGTPVAPAAAASWIVPDADKWAAGITEHIPYENLPGATGAWQRMSNLMKRVREQLVSKR
ncbi:zinc finger CCHC domain-containing protein 8-like [Pollicipes pollicipes]|uniref:zinc finger CCHC domain-containing protein 8-like n=1 Tax=Pollicipes pollicipes TaxID=41117 RepID=UPI001885085D|nr:zinc finger CCHC domain-containing protein 8-like [Pollicipes pollicipes]